MSHKLYLIAMGIFCVPPAWGTINYSPTPSMPAFALGQGVLSYSYFNLSGQNCTLTPEGAGPNPAGYGPFARLNGWMNSGEWNPPALFNPGGIPYSWFSSLASNNIFQYITKQGTNDYFTSSYVFFDWPYSPIATELVKGGYTFANGISVNVPLQSAAFNNWSWNTPAMGDSWYLSCTTPSGSQPVNIAIASLATSQNGLQSGNTGFMYINGVTTQISPYYWYPATPASFLNNSPGLGNPIAQGNPNQSPFDNPLQPCYGEPSPYYYSCSNPANSALFSACLVNPDIYANPDANNALSWGTNPNPCGAGFTAPSSQEGSVAYNWFATSGANTWGGLWTGINYQNYSAVQPQFPAIFLVNMPMLPVNLSTYVQANGDNPGQLDPPLYWSPVFGGQLTYALGDPFVVSGFAAKILAFLATNPNSAFNQGASLSSMAKVLTTSTQVGGTQVTIPPIFPLDTIPYNYVEWLMGSTADNENGVAQTAASNLKTAYNAASTPQKTQLNTSGRIYQFIADRALSAVSSAWDLLPGGKGIGVVMKPLTNWATGQITSQINSGISSAYSYTTNPTQPLSSTAPPVVNPTYSATNLLGLLLTNTGVQSEVNFQLTGTPSNGNANPLWSNYSAYIDGCDQSAFQVNGNLLIANCNGTMNGPNAPNPNGTQPTYTNVYAGPYSNPNPTPPPPPPPQALSLWSAILTGSDIVVNSDGWLVLGEAAGSSPPFQPPTQLYSPSVPSTFGSNATNPSINTTFNANTFTMTVQSIQWTIPAGGTCASPASLMSGTNTTCEYAFDPSTVSTLNYMSCVKDQYATGGIIATFNTGSSLSTTSVVLGCACVPSYLIYNVSALTGASSSAPPTQTCAPGG